jgi:hypothetical protein
MQRVHLQGRIWPDSEVGHPILLSRVRVFSRCGNDWNRAGLDDWPFIKRQGDSRCPQYGASCLSQN